MLVRNQRDTFRQDEFLALLAHQSQIRFSPYEHAPIEERRDRFRDAIQAAQLPLTFIESGINVRIEIANSTASATSADIEFESQGFVFSGVWVRVIGTINSQDLKGHARLELFTPQQPADVPALTSEQLHTLQSLGLPL